MKARVFRLALAAPLLAALVGCGGGDALKRAYTAAAYEVAKVPTEAMLPTIRPGDYISIDEKYYKKHPVQRFDMVSFTMPPENVPQGVEGIDANTTYVKRVVALGGETVEVKDGGVYVNGSLLQETFETVPLERRDRFGPIKVPEGEFFMMGDNRPNSMDGRYWARPTLPARYVRGKVIEIFHE